MRRLAPFVLVLAACSSDDPCLSSGTCPATMRCAFEGGETGFCVPCAEEEIPYDGEDNDCLDTTPDGDQDGDGDNWLGAPFGPGGDCDDDDPLVSSKQMEICADEKDNDCDGEEDEPDCGPQAAPVVRISTPTDGAVVRGTIEIVVTASDDIGLDIVQLVGPRGVQLGSRREGPFRFSVDTLALDDGLWGFEATATDVAGIQSVHRIGLQIDNASGPTITLLSGPMEGLRYGGDLVFDVRADDPSEVAALRVEIDEVRVATSSTSTLAARYDSRQLTDGPHALALFAWDTHGAERVDRWMFRVDNTPPSVTFDKPTDGADVTSPFDIEVTATDASGVRTVTYGDLQVAGTPLTGAVTLPPGLHTLTATATDVVTVDGALVGNRGITRITVRVAN